MKKLLPIVMFVLLAFAGCQRGPAMYQESNNPREIVPNAEKFVDQVSKQSKHYNAEDWQVVVNQFVCMGKDFWGNKNLLTESEIMRFDYARLEFMAAIDKNGNEDITAQVKKLYGELAQ